MGGQRWLVLLRISISHCGSRTYPGGQMRARSVAVLAVLAVVAGCNGATDPPSGVNGTWTYTATNLSASYPTPSGNDQLLCDLNMYTVLTQSGSTFAGTFAGSTVALGGPRARLDCSQGIRWYVDGPVADGTISGDTVIFDALPFPSSAWTFTGTISGNSMSGNVSIVLPVCPIGTPTCIVHEDTVPNPNVIFKATGHWSATRS